jgi:uncharacterized membrane protein (UPF0127 family)
MPGVPRTIRACSSGVSARALRVPAAGAALLAAALLLGACGDDSGGGDAADDGTLPTAPTLTSIDAGTVEPEMPEDIAEASGNAPAAAGSGLAEPPGDPARTPLAGFDEVALGITRPDGTQNGFCVLAALVALQRQRGLMHVEDLQGYSGMIFTYAEDTDTGFYMLNTPMPLSIAWFDAEGELVDTADMEPCLEEPAGGCPTYHPSGSYRFAVEVPQGGLDELGIEPGSRLTTGGACVDATG